jgi:hypothetical protein
LSSMGTEVGATQPSRAQEENRRLVKPLVTFFDRIKNLPVIAKRDDTGPFLAGSDEFGIEIDGENKRVDVLVFSWDSEGYLCTKAVEAKLASSPSRSIEEALGQATDYQALFDEVYVATQEGNIGNHHLSLLSDLGLGWFSVTPNGDVKERLIPDHKRRFDSGEYIRQVAPRLTVALAFLTLFDQEKPIRFGMTGAGGIYVAKEYTPVSPHIQLNAWFEPKTQLWFDPDRKPFAGIGFNLEHKPGWRAILQSKPDLPKISRTLRDLTSLDYDVRLVKVPNPHPKNAQDIPIELIDKTSAAEIFQKVEQVLKPSSKFRPHLTVSKKFLETTHEVPRSEALEVASKSRIEIERLISCFCDDSESCDWNQA